MCWFWVCLPYRDASHLKTTANEFVIYMVLYMQAAWDEKILELVLQRLSDHTERCRELAIQLISDVACAITEVRQMLPTY